MKVRTALALVLSVLFLSSVCGSAQGQDVKVDDIKTLAGKWFGYVTVRGSTFPVTLSVKEDGSYSTFVGTRTVEGVIRVADGKMTFQSTTNRGVVSLRESKGKRTLRFAIDTGEFTDYEEQK